MQKLLGQVRRCVEDYRMIDAGDTVAVGVSGGKDSLVTLTALARLRAFYPIPFTVHAITLETGTPGMCFDAVADLCRQLDVPYTRIQVPVYDIVFNERKEKNPCSLCARMRRGILHNICVEEGISKLALGHHFDDAVQTFFMNLFYGGKIGCFSPKTYLSRKKITVIRPLVFCEEREITGAARRLALPIVKSACPADGVTARKDTADLVKQLEKQFPHLRTKVLGAMQRANLDGWGDTTS